MANKNGGAVYIDDASIMFEGNSTVTFNSNVAESNGGALCITALSFDGNPTMIFNYNSAGSNGGAVYIYYNKKGKFFNYDHLILYGNPTVTFNNNEATTNGGAMYLVDRCIKFAENLSLSFHNNKAINNNGGACVS